jgi:hypothetical protein
LAWFYGWYDSFNIYLDMGNGMNEPNLLERLKYFLRGDREPTTEIPTELLEAMVEALSPVLPEDVQEKIEYFRGLQIKHARFNRYADAQYAGETADMLERLARERQSWRDHCVDKEKEITRLEAERYKYKSRLKRLGDERPIRNYVPEWELEARIEYARQSVENDE